jgi:hypothetical protein
MMKLAFKLIFIIACLSACTFGNHCTPSQEEYGMLQSAVTFSADKVFGEYGETIPENFSTEGFKALVKDRIPASYFRELEKYALTVTPEKTHYYLTVTCPADNSVLLFDYSCTLEVDGPVYLSPGKYEPGKDPCD